MNLDKPLCHEENENLLVSLACIGIIAIMMAWCVVVSVAVKCLLPESLAGGWGLL